MSQESFASGDRFDTVASFAADGAPIEFASNAFTGGGGGLRESGDGSFESLQNGFTKLDAIEASELHGRLIIEITCGAVEAGADNREPDREILDDLRDESAVGAGAFLVGNDAHIGGLKMAGDFGVGDEAGGLEVRIRETVGGAFQECFQGGGFMADESEDGLRKIAQDAFDRDEGDVTQMVVIERTMHDDDGRAFAIPGSGRAKGEEI